MLTGFAPRRSANHTAWYYPGPSSSVERLGDDCMKPALLLFAPVVALLVTLHGETLPQGQPSEVGLSKDRLDRIGVVMDKEIKSGRLAGGIGLIARRGKIAYFEAYGMAD